VCQTLLYVYTDRETDDNIYNTLR